MEDLLRYPGLFEAGPVKKRKPHISLEWYLLDELYQHSQLVLRFGSQITYGAYWTREETILAPSSEYGLLLVDHWGTLEEDLATEHSPFRVYLRAAGYALIWREGVKRRGFGEWRAVLRPLKHHEASVALGGREGIFALFLRIARQLAPLFKHPMLGRDAAKFAFWLRTVPQEVKRLGL